jgi:hypothetical protein
MGAETIVVETLSELHKELDRVHELYVIAYAELEKAREANRKLRCRLAEAYRIEEVSEDERDHTAST